MRAKRARSFTVAALAAAGLLAAGGQPAAAAGPYPVEYHFGAGFVKGFFSPDRPPAGANDPSCRPSAAHPAPVVLVHGTLENMNDYWGGAAPLLANAGYCVHAFSYGGAAGSPVQGTGPIAASAGDLAAFVDTVLAATGAREVDLVGHSQGGGLMARYYLKNLGGAAKVGKLVGIAPNNSGTTLDGITELGRTLHILEPANELLDNLCAACVEQEIGSPFLAALDAGGQTVPGVDYTVIATRFDEVVTPYTNAFLPAGPHVTNLTVQDQCPLDATDHLEIGYDPIALTDVLNALDPAHPRPIPCQVVLPVTGPLL
ncbi:LOW QUALITY PROTEIN: triacylglycerol esterase/lipase EstA (alpha/beta hydrolase family) [Streptomyces sp. TLI_235]|nr:LOW QUALITY PROTEIN: triacylglycerol esterase/lipase EstA (alpha/beta hydrolase family) [Streptomyces sp. TLI_235]